MTSNPEVEAALALADANGFDDEKSYNGIHPFVEGYESIGEAAARILAAEVRRLRAELDGQPMIATETHVLPKRK